MSKGYGPCNHFSCKQAELLVGLMWKGWFNQKIKAGLFRKTTVRVAYQCPIRLTYKDESGEEETIPYTFEDSLALTNLMLFRDYQNPKGLLKKLTNALGKDTLNDASKAMFDDLGTGSKAEMALELFYLTEPSELKPPDYISDGLKWLEGKLAEKEQNFLASAPPEVKND
ncbi:MAG TPA: hypothetical protein ENH01_02245 [Nitrospirae bacterium]|nr:hypothetical protein [Nitrospirota bacterium]